MALLLDNDIVEKLAQLDLLPEAKNLLKAKFGQLMILNTLRYKLCPQRESQRKKRNATVMSRIEDFIKDNISEINCVVDDKDLIDALVTNPEGLDAGEMQLLQTLLKPENEMLMTGDKRFLKAISKFDFLEGKQINGNMVCLEQIIYFLIKELGFEKIKSKVIQALESDIPIDTALRACFGSRHLAVQETVFESLHNYINDIRKDSGSLLSTGEEWSPSIN